MLPVTEKAPVLIVGGSLVGLSAAVFLTHHGIRPILIERHAGSAAHPKALGFRSRTMEMYRSVGLKDKIPLARPDFKLVRTRVHSLAGKWYEDSLWIEEKKKSDSSENEKKTREYDHLADYAWTIGADITQTDLETVLRDFATRNGADIRYSTELIRFKQDANGVSAIVKPRQSGGAEYEIRADYMIAADGNRSSVRESLSIQRHGRGYMQTIRSILFEAPALKEYRDKGPSQFTIDQPDMKAFLTYYKHGRWALMFTDDVQRDEGSYKEAIYKAVGRTDFDLKIITTGEWETTALIADSFQSNRIFLAGDSAHTLPPNRGGYGVNTGIADVWNLAWKLAAVIQGQAKPGLLDTYETERRSVALLRHDQIFCRQDWKIHAPEGAKPVEPLDDIAVELGELYCSKAIFSEHQAVDNQCTAKRPDEWNGQPGTRAAHWWLDGTSSTSIDFYGKDWVLLTESEQWKDAAEKLNESLPGSAVKIRCIQLGVDEKFSDLNGFKKIMGITSTGASLIRPDGIIAWRAMEIPKSTLPDMTLDVILRQVMAQVAFAEGGSNTGKGVF
ncbi:tetracenomycin polyketide synthesis hydroxylase tcmG, putative [Talaromyces stipitatus ATCC 10500]|uniref:Tetracenomycin polyketide synthesis hydroxylase tcmG, putative n=1 Tax=Talaromyces stipitatus (strain ATCC 10500 / CBS 375.48 / QM 6759 / NRRL 1006) TaxID=441959 RepID=B8LVJ5_TALSN|nr:tetracenomycin polyketide synthesis hydroxylase tcmG, putative [Talaromyces stipitatus ATCC 10500]EED24014.1 tetracenomycin polyketide synthesis hydroxylase tcmG, putative [Talaromyces stipitatus ATCC 10500]